ncbi:hypothetical protein C8N30_3879 [Sulfitobacter guttiformis]|uniref:Uncharacterized protein n=1 Tax=Sulfitobacter guttiformis TaxID=74349 RepID=A0A420DGA1_9RHOB|nr:hypothetical protein C8N30_3879 [Sulfitobacter guttiformis]
MTPYKERIFSQIEKVLSQAEPAQIEKLLSDIASGQFCQTAQTRAGDNDNHSNVTNINCIRTPQRAPRDVPSGRYFS